MTAAALSDLRILDRSNPVAGPFCTKLFADFGADVIKVEAPGEGDTARHIGPFPNGAFDLETSCLFLYLNTNKRSITLDVESPTGQSLGRELVAQCDMVVETFDVGVMQEMGPGFDRLEVLRPGLILTSITPFGQTGPWRGYQATDLIAHAASGLSAVNRVAGGKPLREPGYQTDYLEKFTMRELFDGLQPHRILVGMALDMPHLIDNVHFNEEVLEALAGLSPREIERLTEAGITGRTPPRT